MRRVIKGTEVNGPAAAEDRPRTWQLSPSRERGLLEPGQPVLLLGYPVLAPGEHLTEQVPQRRLTWQEWLDTHADYGLAVDGTRMEA